MSSWCQENSEFSQQRLTCGKLWWREHWIGLIADWFSVVTSYLEVRINVTFWSERKTSTPYELVASAGTARIIHVSKLLGSEFD